jgi:hypothetical protein
MTPTEVPNECCPRSDGAFARYEALLLRDPAAAYAFTVEVLRREGLQSTL